MMKISKNKNYWKGLEQLRNDPHFVEKAEKEFPEYLPIKDAYGDNSKKEDDGGTSRRDFLKLMGFSVAAVSLAACEPPIKKAIPYLNKPESVEPGVPNYYASTFAEGGEYCAVVVKTREGRPIFVQGNTLSSLTQGGVNARVSASVLSLYDDEKAKKPSKGGAETTWGAIDKEIISKLQSAGRVYIVSNSVISPTTKRLINEFGANFSNFQHVSYDPVSFSGMIEAHAQDQGKAVTPSFDFSKASVIASFDADFLGSAWLAQVEHTKQYSKTRKVSPDKKEMSRHYQFEARYSMTGGSADERVLMKPSEEGVFVATLFNLIAEKAGENILQVTNSKNEALKRCANELWANRGKSLVVSGSNDKNIQLLVIKINEMLGSYGTTIDLNSPSYQKQGKDADMAAFAQALNGGNTAVIFYNCNPVYDHPLGASIKAGLSKASLSVSTTDRLDETAAACGLHAPDSHYLESWNDAEPKRGIFSLGQPTIRTIYDTRQFQTSLMTWGGMSGDFLTYLKKHWETNVFPLQNKITDFELFWKTSLHDGVFEPKVSGSYKSIHEGATAKTVSQTIVAAVADSVTGQEVDTQEVIEDVVEAVQTGSGSTNWAQVGEAIKALPKANGLELIVYAAPVMGAGRQANNPWIQETPDPMSKVCWGNHLSISAKDAQELGLRDMEEGRIPKVKMTVDGQDLGEVPVVVQPGQAVGTVALAIGYGRAEKAGKVTQEAGGVNMYPFTGDKKGKITFKKLSNVSLEKVEGYVEVAQTQTHQTFMGRETIIQEATLADYKDAKKFKNDRYNPLIATSKGKVDPSDLSIWDINGDGYKSFEEGEVSEAAKDQWKNRHGKNKSDKHSYPLHHWGMAIDLNSCTGCSACLVACSMENNVPVVGKNEVYRRREMHWIRIDRYYASREDAKSMSEFEEVAENPEVVFQPMMCQHCNNAPCETVCPVAATNHSSEGLNQMAYNRCIGTKYCANNCPYKVRRFNWFKYHSNDEFDYHLNSRMGRMVLNPDVMVRSRGVMEKCSMCVQRIQAGKLNAKKEKRKVEDGEVMTACASSCPADALTFGDLNDPNSKVSKMLGGELATGRAYHVLKEINVDPNVWYLTKVRNKGNEKS